ncbi:glycerol-3-phosphate acyltransferase [Paenisporosarcina sp. OV554]|uniref:glycerol-3-phosphate acyltransferase n=1 Tax=Paenisporosarcina sp. OV554 TaxID=2135694 RepID=UPI000D34CF0B|nr:glycerol-3-phosphate acyltransferase [Paenisporosarcina sp. OV554]PUB16842.1 acyl-phosphate glycerol-3-phosphate acyltransferase [Paenisporosarcina sp. OV554]
MIVYFIGSLLIGNILTAWWVGKFYKIDLRNHRSGNLGARNAGAVIGKGAFLFTFLGDASKGVIVILAGRYLGYPEWAVALGGLLVICGHIFPIWLKGKGGKGIATFVGIGLTFNLLFAIAFIVAFSLVFPFIRSATLSMIFGYLAYIGSVFYFNEVVSAWPIIVAIVLILYRHRFDFQQSFDEQKWKRS